MVQGPFTSKSFQISSCVPKFRDLIHKLEVRGGQSFCQANGWVKKLKCNVLEYCNNGIKVQNRGLAAIPALWELMLVWQYLWEKYCFPIKCAWYFFIKNYKGWMPGLQLQQMSPSLLIWIWLGSFCHLSHGPWPLGTAELGPWAIHLLATPQEGCLCLILVSLLPEEKNGMDI